MNERDELADVYTGHPVGFGPTPAKLMRGHAQEIAAAVLAAGYRKPRTITNTEELDGLPNGSVVLHEELRHVAVRWSVQDWVVAGAAGDNHYADIKAALPLTVLYEPEPRP